MDFFKDDFYKELDKDYAPEDELQEQFDDDVCVDDLDISVNKQNMKEYKDVIDNAVTQYDSYWDVRNPIVKFILIFLFIIIILGIIYYIVSWIMFI